MVDTKLILFCAIICIVVLQIVDGVPVKGAHVKGAHVRGAHVKAKRQVEPVDNSEVHPGPAKEEAKRSAAPVGSHIMPDGQVMLGSTHEEAMAFENSLKHVVKRDAPVQKRPYRDVLYIGIWSIPPKPKAQCESKTKMSDENDPDLEVLDQRVLNDEVGNDEVDVPDVVVENQVDDQPVDHNPQINLVPVDSIETGNEPEEREDEHVRKRYRADYDRHWSSEERFQNEMKQLGVAGNQMEK